MGYRHASMASGISACEARESMRDDAVVNSLLLAPSCLSTCLPFASKRYAVSEDLRGWPTPDLRKYAESIR